MKFRRMAFLALSFSGLALMNAVGLTAVMSFDKQCRASDLIAEIEIVRIDPITGAEGTQGPLNMAVARVVKIYKGEKLYQWLTKNRENKHILIPCSYSVDDSPTGFAKEGLRCIVLLKRLRWGAMFVHLEFNCT